jgi:hypothetical protein
MVDTEWSVEGGYSKANQWVDELDIPRINILRGDEREAIEFGNLAEATTEELEGYLSQAGAWLAFVDLNLSSLTSKKGAYETTLDMSIKVAKADLSRDWAEHGYTKKPTIDEMEGIILKENKRVRGIAQVLTEITVAYDKLQGRKEAFRGLFNTASRVLSARSLEAGKHGQ